MNDPDPALRGRKTRFTKNEQITLMNLWCVFRSPLMMGGELTKSDEFTFSLLTNRELPAINQHSDKNHPILNEGERAIWTCEDENGSPVYAIFNLKTEPQTVSCVLSVQGTGTDLWTGKTFPVYAKDFSLRLGARESVIFRVN